MTEMLSMASAATSMDPLLVSLKAVEPGKYPFYGTVVLAPAMPLSAALTDTTVAVGDDLLLRLHLKVGDSIKLGTEMFRISAVVVDEPDRLSGIVCGGAAGVDLAGGAGQDGVGGAGVAGDAAIFVQAAAGAGGKALSDAAVAELKTKLEALMPEAQISDYREANPALTKALDGATGLLSLMSLVALVLGAVGVAMAMRSHLQQRLDSIAIMKSLGAGSRQIMKIYLLQTLLLGLGGGLLGVVLGIGVQLSFPFFLAKLLHLTPTLHLQPRAIGLGLGAGLLTTLLFTLPPLLDIRNVRPILILRRNVEAADDPFATRLVRKLRGSVAQIGASVLILLGLVGLASRVSDSARVGWTFALGLAASLLVLLGMAALTLWLLRKFLRGTGLSLPSTLRHGLANLYRPGNPSAALLAALGLGVMQIAAVYFVQHSIVNEMQVAAAGDLPNIFLMDMGTNEVGGVRTLLSQQPMVKGTPEMIPVVSARLTQINGETLEKRRQEIGAGPSGRNAQTLNVTWPPSTDGPPPGDTVVRGAWWTAQQAADGAQHPLVAMARGACGPAEGQCRRHDYCVCAGRADYGDSCGGVRDGQPACGVARGVCDAAGYAGGAAGGLVWRRALRSEGDGGAAAGAV